MASKARARRLWVALAFVELFCGYQGGVLLACVRQELSQELDHLIARALAFLDRQDPQDAS